MPNSCDRLSSLTSSSERNSVFTQTQVQPSRACPVHATSDSIQIPNSTQQHTPLKCERSNSSPSGNNSPLVAADKDVNMGHISSAHQSQHSSGTQPLLSSVISSSEDASDRPTTSTARSRAIRTHRNTWRRRVRGCFHCFQ